ncbi:MAG: hypothetical protein WEB63_11540 [Cucumibacter sp.]
MFENRSGNNHFARDTEARQLALEYLADAWSNAEEDGVKGEALAHAALFAAIATLVRDYGEEAVAEIVNRLPDRIRLGEYSLDRSVQ